MSGGPILFICPVTKMLVQHWLEDREDATEDEHEGIDCPACSNLHFINRKTGKVLGVKTRRLNP
jgi:hypothetical protein